MSFKKLAIVSYLIVAAQAHAQGAMQPVVQGCTVTGRVGVFDVQVAAGHTIDICAEPGKQIASILTIADRQGWVIDRPEKGADMRFAVAARANSMPTNVIVTWNDGSRTELQLRVSTTASTEVAALRN